MPFHLSVITAHNLLNQIKIILYYEILTYIWQFKCFLETDRD